MKLDAFDFSQKVEAGKKLSRIDTSFELFGLRFDSFWCRVAFASNEDRNLKPHSHTAFELQACLSGEGVFEVEGNEIRLTPGTFFITPRKTIHKNIGSTKDFSKFIWSFEVTADNDGKNSIVNALEAISVPTSATVFTDDLLFSVVSVLDNAEKCDPCFYDLIRTNLYNIFISALRSCAVIKQSEDIKEKSFDARFSDINKFILDNLENRLSVEDIAKEFSMSSRQLSRICEASCGLSIGKLKNALAIKRAKEYLSEGSLALKEIAERVGYSDEFSFAKSFKREEGIAPGEYRKSLAMR